MSDRDRARIEQLLGNDQPISNGPMSPTEQMLAAAAPEVFGEPWTAEDEAVHLPWTPTGQEKAQRTVEGVNLVGSPPPPETAGGAIPSSRIPMRQFGPEGS